MNHCTATIAAALIAAIWQGAILAGIVALTLRLLPAMSAGTRSLIWATTFAVLVALHFVPALHPVGTAVSASAHPLRFAPVWSLGLAIVWLALSLFRAAQFVLSAQRLRQINRRAIPVSGYQAESAIAGRSYTLCTSPDVDRPSVLGFFHPRILLPEGLYETLTRAELQQILLHETEHLRRSDDWTNLLQKLALTLFPLNPVLFWVERRLCLERELACDARVLATGETLRKSYASTLTRLAEHSILRRGLNLALGFPGHKTRPSELSLRIHRILANPGRTLTRTQARLATVAVLGGVLALSTTLAHAPSLITFAPEAMPEQARNPGISVLPSESSAPRLVDARAVVRSASRPAYRTIDAVAHVPIVMPRRLKKVHSPQQAARLPRVRNISYPRPEVDQQPRLTLTVASGTQVQQFVVPAVAYVPAYAAIRTPGGWIIFQL